MPAPTRLCLPPSLHDELLAQLLAEAPLEGCGLLAGDSAGLHADGPGGRAAHARVRYPLASVAASPVLYEADPRDLLRAHRDMRERGIDLVAVYHSHPTSAPVPSATDHARWFQGPEVVCLIVSLAGETPLARAWLLDEGAHREIPVRVE